MKVLAKILDVQERRNTENPKKSSAIVTMSSGEDVMQCRLFASDLERGDHKTFKDAVGQEGFVDVSADLYQGRLQYKFGFDKSFDTKTAGPSLAKAS